MYQLNGNPEISDFILKTLDDEEKEIESGILF